MNHRGGIALIKSSWASWMQYRGFFFVLAFGWMIPPLIYLFIWSTAAGDEALGGMSRGVFVGYYLILILVNQLTYAQTNWTVGDVIREGSLSSWLLRPIPTVYHPLATEVAGKVVCMSFVIPIAAMLTLVLRPELNASLNEMILFLPALALAWLLRFFWGYTLALLAFWSPRADALLALQDTLIFLLAGMVAPVTLLPTSLQQIARLLPFRYMLGFPVEVITRQATGSDLAAGFLLQLGWLALALVLWRLT